MMQILKDCITCKDGVSYDIGRILWLLFGVAFLAFVGYDLFFNHHFDLSNFGSNAAAILAGGGAGVGLKGHTEPE